MPRLDHLCRDTNTHEDLSKGGEAYVQCVGEPICPRDTPAALIYLPTASCGLYSIVKHVASSLNVARGACKRGPEAG